MIEEILANIAIGIGFIYIAFVCYNMGAQVALAITPRPTFKQSSQRKKKKFPDTKPKNDPRPPVEKRPKHFITVTEAQTILKMTMDELKVHISSGALQTYLHGGVMYIDGKDVVKLQKKGFYPVVADYDDSHRITNPVEFDT
tara:strand:+ start:501 stop:926 length:426 start_codon:yes stop_codon:yes gene_type:complete